MFWTRQPSSRPTPPCPCCGSQRYKSSDVLWPELIAEWELSSEEVVIVNRQQGRMCVSCGVNMRSAALADAIMAYFDHRGTFVQFVSSTRASDIKVLEINVAGQLHPWLRELPGHLLVEYPQVDMQSLPFHDSQFDLVVHSDTLEHVQDPVKALSECRRVLQRIRGACVFTVPIIPGRLTRRRHDLPASYHGDRNGPNRYLVHSEYGADYWRDVFDAGFANCSVRAFEYPAALAIIASS